MKDSELLDVLIEDIKTSFDLNCTCEHMVTGGWKNRKWKLKCNNRYLLLKELSEERYNEHKIIEIIKSLKVQQISNEKFGVAPNIITNNRGLIQYTNNLRYLIMDYSEGEHKDYETISSENLFKLGRAIAQLHSVDVSEIYALGEKEEDHLLILKEHVSKMDAEKTLHSRELIDAIEKVKSIMSEIDEDIFNKMKIGFTHSDFSKDNILFAKDGVRILDFDRGRINYQLQDIGRAIMSFAYNRNGIDLIKVKNFEQGYNSVQSLNKEDIINSLRLIWVIEVAWWFNMFVFCQSQTTKILEFKDQILYLTEHYNTLNDIFKHY